MASYLTSLITAFLNNPEHFADVKAIVDAPLRCSAQELVTLISSAEVTPQRLMMHMDQPGDDLLPCALKTDDKPLGRQNFLDCFYTKSSLPYGIAHSATLPITKSFLSQGGSGNIVDKIPFVRSATTNNDNENIPVHLNDMLDLVPRYVRDFEKRHLISSDQPEHITEEAEVYAATTNEFKAEALNDYYSRIGDLGQGLIRLWADFYKKINPAYDQERLTLLPLPEPFVVPGGRFIEVYYWDTYWIIRGLLASGLNHVAKDILRNFFFLVERYGFIPNGSRSYYLDRSQPPVLSSTLRAYYLDTGDISFVDEHMDLLEREYSYWMSRSNGHSVSVDLGNGETGTLNRYYSELTTPRPESYRIDLMLGAEYEKRRASTGRPVGEFYRAIRAAAESGWDFSSRWLRPAIERGDMIAEEDDPNTDKHLHDICLIDIDTANVLPVDLNAWLYLLEVDLAYFFKELHQTDRSEIYLKRAEQRKKAMWKYNYDPENKRWMDYDLKTKSRSKVHSAASFVPLWAGLDDGVKDPEYRLQMLEPLGELVRKYGVVSTTLRAGLQWDSPNVWAPNHQIAVDFLAGGRFWEYNEAFINEKSTAREFAANLASRFVNSVLHGYETTGKCSEKYHYDILGKSGQDGEYITQDGFGWTNGSVLDMLRKFKRELTPQGLYQQRPKK